MATLGSVLADREKRKAVGRATPQPQPATGGETVTPGGEDTGGTAQPESTPAPTPQTNDPRGAWGAVTNPAPEPAPPAPPPANAQPTAIQPRAPGVPDEVVQRIQDQQDQQQADAAQRVQDQRDFREQNEDPSLGYGMDLALARAQNPDATPFNPNEPVIDGPGNYVADMRAQPTSSQLPHGTPIGGGVPDPNFIPFGGNIAPIDNTGDGMGNTGTGSGHGAGGGIYGDGDPNTVGGTTHGDAGVSGGGGDGTVNTAYGAGGVNNRGGSSGGSNTLSMLLNRRMQNSGDRAQEALNQQRTGLEGIRDRVAGRDNVAMGDAHQQFRGEQQNLINALQQTAYGQAGADPLSQAMLAEARERNRADAASMAASARGRVNPAQLAKQQANMVAQTNQDAQRSGMLAALQQQQQARSLLGDVATGAREQDINVGMFDTEAAIQQEQYRDAAQSALVGDIGNTGIAKYNLDKTVADDEWVRQRALAGEDIQRRGIDAGIAINAAQIDSNEQLARNQLFAGIAGSALGAFGNMLGGGATSDATAKENIQEAGKDIDVFLDSAKGYKYDYIEPDKAGRAPGKRWGILAQNLLKSDAGKSIVRQDEEGVLQVDVSQGYGTLLAAMGRLNERYKELDKKLKKGKKK